MAFDNLNINYGETLTKDSGLGLNTPSDNGLVRESIGPGLPQSRELLGNSINSPASDKTVNPDLNNGPKTLFYNAGMYDPDSAKFNTFLFYSFSGANPGSDTYYRSENRLYNRRVTSTASKNPSAGNLVKSGDYSKRSNTTSDIIGGESAPYFWKDFLYCKYYGTIPNNRLITLRRFPHPMPDNLESPSAAFKNEGAARPVAQAVTWFGGSTGNLLNSIISFGTGINWKDVSQNEKSDVPTLDSGIFGAATGILSKLPLASVIGSAAEKFNGGLGENLSGGGDQIINYIDSLVTDGGLSRIEASTLASIVHNDKWTTENGPLQDFIFAPVNTINNMTIRDLGLSWDKIEFSVKFHYELSSVGEVNSKAAFFDVLANLLSIGTNYGNWLMPAFLRDQNGFPAIEVFGGNEGVMDFYADPVKFVRNKLSFINGGSLDDSAGGLFENIKKKAGSNDIQSAVDKLTAGGSLFTNDAFKSASAVVTNLLTLNNAIEPPVTYLTGMPTGEWHLTVGNPYNPIATIGNLVCSGVKINFGESLGPDDFPTEITAEFTLKHARDRERGDIESMFNRGKGRLYQSTKSVISDEQTGNSRRGLYGNEFINGVTSNLDPSNSKIAYKVTENRIQ